VPSSSQSSSARSHPYPRGYPGIGRVGEGSAGAEVGHPRLVPCNRSIPLAGCAKEGGGEDPLWPPS